MTDDRPARTDDFFDADAASRRDALPEHELRDEQTATIGGGLTASGGTAVDRGTGTLRGDAQGPTADDDEGDAIDLDDPGDRPDQIGAQGIADMQARHPELDNR